METLPELVSDLNVCQIYGLEPFDALLPASLQRMSA